MAFLIIQQLLLLSVFLIAGLFLFTFPGVGIIRLLKIKFPGFVDKYVISTAFGFCLFTLIVYLLSFLYIRNLIWVFILSGVLEAIKNISCLPQLLKKIKQKIFSKFSLILLIGCISMVSINAASGLSYPGGLLFWSAHGHDGIWHIALLEQMKTENFPFTNPEYAGHKLQNYHFFIDLVISEISRIFYFSPFDLYFRMLPVLLSGLLGLLCFSFVRRWSGSYISGLWSMVFVYFLGNFGYVVTLIRNSNLNGESVFWIPQLFSVQGNPPQAAAVMIMAALTYGVLAFLRNNERNFFVPIVILGSVLVEFKVYAAIVFFGAFLLVAIYELLFKRNMWAAGLFVSTLMPAGLMALPNSSGVAGYLIYEPWWFIRTMVVASDKLNWMDLELRRQTYLSEYNYKRVIQLELTALSIYVAGNIGVRIIGLVQAVKMLLLKKVFRDSFDLFFLAVIVLSFGIPLIFLQKGVAYNIIQTSQYALLFLSFLSAITIGDFFSQTRNRVLLITISLTIVLSGIPTQLGLLWGFYSNSPNTVIYNNQIEALRFLREKSRDSDIVLAYPYDKYNKDKYSSLPLPINVWSDTGYVSALSSRKTLITDQEQLQIMGYDADKLFEQRKEIFESKDYKAVNDFLAKYKINFVYLEKGEEFAADSAKLDMGRIYNKEGIRIYKVNSI